MAQQIILTPEQVQVYHASTQPVAVCDSAGKVLGTLAPDYSVEFLDELKRRARVSGKRFSSEAVTRHMQALSEAWKREGPFDRDGIADALRTIRTEDSR